MAQDGLQRTHVGYVGLWALHALRRMGLPLVRLLRW
jgi:hypothetical protein